MKKKTTNTNQDAFALFPDVLRTFKTKQHTTDRVVIAPPSSPDISWLKSDQQDGQKSVPDVPMALILMSDNKREPVILTALERLGYQVEIVDTPFKAIEKIQFHSIAVLIQHTNFEKCALSESIFHKYLNGLSMKKRRNIFYILTGPDFHTLYNLEALAYSANLVVNDKDLTYLGLILKKSFRDFEDLFSCFLDTLDGTGNR